MINLMQEGRRLRVPEFLWLILQILPLISIPLALRVPSLLLLVLEVGVLGLAVEIGVIEPERTLVGLRASLTSILHHSTCFIAICV